LRLVYLLLKVRPMTQHIALYSLLFSLSLYILHFVINIFHQPRIFPCNCIVKYLFFLPPKFFDYVTLFGSSCYYFIYIVFSENWDVPPQKFPQISQNSTQGVFVIFPTYKIFLSCKLKGHTFFISTLIFSLQWFWSTV